MFLLAMLPAALATAMLVAFVVGTVAKMFMREPFTSAWTTGTVVRHKRTAYRARHGWPGGRHGTA